MSERQKLADDVRAMREQATLVVQRHAAVYAPDVPADVVTAICGALGDISVDEAMAALNRLQEWGHADA